VSARILAIDPGTTESAWVVIDAKTCRPIIFNKQPNREIFDAINTAWLDLLVIEMIASFGMPVGAEVFETCVWIGRFEQFAYELGTVENVQRVTRRPIKLHHCGNAAAKDANIIQALIDRFAPGTRNRGKGTKHAPGWFHGFRADVWQAYALAVYAADTLTDTEGVPL
jgi:hypothetical protein